MTEEAKRAELGGIDEAQRRISVIRAAPHYLALSRMIGEQIRKGSTLRAFRMLRAMGAPDKFAHDIVEGWEGDRVLDVSNILSGGALGGLAVTAPEVHALRLSYFIDGFAHGSHPWARILRRVLEDDCAYHPEDYAAMKTGALELLRGRLALRRPPA